MKKRKKYSKCRKCRRQICLCPLRVWISCPRLVYSRKWIDSLRSTVLGTGGINFALGDGRGPGTIRCRHLRENPPVWPLLIGTIILSLRQSCREWIKRHQHQHCQQCPHHRGHDEQGGKSCILPPGNWPPQSGKTRPGPLSRTVFWN